MNQDLIFAIYDYAFSIKNSNDYLMLKKLNEQIEIELKDLLDDFKDKKEKYEEARKYKNYYKNFSQICKEFSLAKERLYSNSLVVMYKEYENRIRDELELLSNSLNEVLR